MLGRCLLSLPAARVPSLAYSRHSLVRNPIKTSLWATRTMTSSSSPSKFLCVHVFVTCKPGTEEAFRLATLENARQSALEPGIARFDVLQDTADPTQFCLVEVYHNNNDNDNDAVSPETNEAAKAHKETEHYLKWRDTVADMMAEPRRAVKFVNHFPTTTAGWSYPEGASLE